jgi:hypothetical protein
MIITAAEPACPRRWCEPHAIHDLRRRWRIAALRRGGRRLAFIAGCARSGTSLLKQLMAVFRNTAVFPKERPVWHILEMAGAAEATLVVKRTADCHRSLHRLPTAVELVYCVRHPYDVLTSSHPLSVHLRPYHVTRERWFAEWHALRRLRRRQPGRRIATVRYEDLVCRPDDVQAAIAAHLGLGFEQPFSANTLGVEIRPTSLEKWRTRPELRRYLAGLDPAWHAEIARFCAEFGYATGGLG